MNDPDYLNTPLTFTDTEIYYTSSVTGQKFSVMMDWEHDIMSASAAYVCENGGDILELGFGMGISAGYIQSHSITSHTICENHPDVIPKAVAWASDKPNVTIVSQSWYDAFTAGDLNTYDGLFHDTWLDVSVNNLSASLSSLLNPGGKASWFNSVRSQTNPYNIPNTTYQRVDCSPPPNNGYFIGDHYYVPKFQYV
jgi:protein arginine N-methyltransferase 2